MILSTLALLAASRAQTPPPLGYALETRVYAAVCAGSTPAQRYASAAAEPSLGNWRLAYVAWTAQAGRPVGTASRASADVAAAWAAQGAILTVDPLRQGGYRAESDLGYPRLGDPRGEGGLVYAYVVVACPFPSLDDARTFVSGVTAMRRLRYEERDAYVGGLAPQGWGVPPGAGDDDPRRSLARLPWGYYDGLRSSAPVAYVSAVPAWALAAPDRSDVMPASVVAPVPYQSAP